MNIELSPHWSFNFRNDPKRLGFVLSRYKFAARMTPKKGAILELGCSEGIGATLFMERARNYVGIDYDEKAIQSAKKNIAKENITFILDDFMGKVVGSFDAVSSLDVVEHIHPEFEKIYFETIVSNLTQHGICIIGTPNATSAPYASHASQIGHVNLFTQERLTDTLKRYFHQVLPFGMNDELVHTGYAQMTHYIFCIGCHKK